MEEKYHYFKWSYPLNKKGFYIVKCHVADINNGTIIYVDTTYQFKPKVGVTTRNATFGQLFNGKVADEAPTETRGAWSKVTEEYVNSLLNSAPDFPSAVPPPPPPYKPTPKIEVKKRNIAFYKISGQPWTIEEYEKIIEYTGDDPLTEYCIEDIQSDISLHHRYIVDNGSPQEFMNLMKSTEKLPNHGKLSYIAYETVFKEVCSTTLSIADGTNASQYAISNQNNQFQIKGNEMGKEKNVDVKVIVNGNEVNCGKNKAPKVYVNQLARIQDTKEGKGIVVWFDANGGQVSMGFGTKKQARAELQKPTRLGWTYRFYEVTESQTTNIPTKTLEV